MNNKWLKNVEALFVPELKLLLTASNKCGQNVLY